jgi:phage terminase large subunit-like protein
MAWDLSCVEWPQRLEDGRSLVPDLPLDRKAADRAITIFNRLKLPDVIGNPVFAEAFGDWFRDIVAALFGSVVGGERMVREIFELVPKKNVKTTGGAGMMLTAMMVNRRPRAEFYLIGPTQSIADDAYGQAVGIIGVDDELRRRFKIQDHIRKITYRGQVASTLQIKTFDSSVITGKKISGGVLVDEIHELGKISGASNVLGELRGGMQPYPEAFLVMLTTQSNKAPAGIFKTELLKARMIRDGEIPARGLLPVLYEFPKAVIDSGAWRDPASWAMITPNAGRSISIPRLIEQCETDEATGEEAFQLFCAKHLNIEIGVAIGSTRWAGANYWEACADRTLTLEALIERSEVIVLGADGGGLDDLLGFAVLGREKGTGRWLLWTRAWVFRKALGQAPEGADEKAVRAAVKHRKSDVVTRLLDFAKDGDLKIVDNVGDDIHELGELVEQVAASGKLPEENAVGLDPYCIGAIVKEFGRRHIDTEKALMAIPQGWKMTGAITTAARELAGGRLVHAGQPMMAWCVGNAKVEPKGNAISITKQAAGSAKIDPLMAMFDAVAVMALNPEPSEYGSNLITILDAA